MRSATGSRGQSPFRGQSLPRDWSLSPRANLEGARHVGPAVLDFEHARSSRFPLGAVHEPLRRDGARVLQRVSNLHDDERPQSRRIGRRSGGCAVRSDVSRRSWPIRLVGRHINDVDQKQFEG